jgi:hypothetical protein
MHHHSVYTIKCLWLKSTTLIGQPYGELFIFFSDIKEVVFVQYIPPKSYLLFHVIYSIHYYLFTK